MYKTSSKNTPKQTCIDPILRQSVLTFRNTTAINRGFSGFQRKKPKLINYRNYK